MATVQVAPGGNAPDGTKIGDIVVTAGGNYQVVEPNTPGANYNPTNGLWSVKVDGTGIMKLYQHIILELTKKKQ